MAQVYSVWVSEFYVDYDSAIHAKKDDQFTLISLRGRENSAVTGEIAFPNPGVGLLSASRRRFVLISESETDDPADAVLVARARILGMPTDFGAATITTDIICAPDNLDELLADAAEAHYALPYADPLFGDEIRDPTAAIAARGGSWHIDPRTHAITITDVLGGGPLVDIGSDHAGSFSIRVTEPPLRAVTETLEIDWDQAASGAINAASQISEFDTVSPEPEVEIGGAGWTLGQNYYRQTGTGTLKVKRGFRLKDKYKQYTYHSSVLAGTSGGQPFYRHYWAETDFDALKDRLDAVGVRSFEFERLIASFDYRQARREIVHLEMSLPVQDVMGAVAVEDLGVYTLADPTIDTVTPVWYPGRAGVAGEFVQHDGKRWKYKTTHALDYVYSRNHVNGRLVSITTPGFEAAPSIAAMPDRRSPSFIDSLRGQQAIQHALLLMRARLRYRLRCLEATVRPSDWIVMRDVGMDQSLRADHPRFGSVEGKVIAWDRSWVGGDQPYRIGTITVGACLGTGTTGDGDVADVDFVVSSEAVAVPINAYALGSPAYAVSRVVVANDAEAQADLAVAEVAAGRDPTNTLASAITSVRVELLPLSTVSTIERKVAVTATLLDSPQGYDAGAD